MASNWYRYGSSDPEDFHGDYLGHQSNRGSQNQGYRHERWKPSTYCWMITASFMVLIITTTIIMVGMQTSSSQGSLSTTDSPYSAEAFLKFPLAASGTPCAATGQISLKVSNEYGTYAGSYPWMNATTHLIEPYKVTTLELSGFSSCADSVFVWTVTGSTLKTHTGNALTVESTAPIAEMTLTLSGTFILSVGTRSSSGKLTKVCQATLFSR